MDSFVQCTENLFCCCLHSFHSIRKRTPPTNHNLHQSTKTKKENISRKIMMDVLQYCTVNRILKVRLSSFLSRCTLRDVTTSFQQHHNDWNKAQTVTLSISHDYFSSYVVDDSQRSQIQAFFGAVVKVAPSTKKLKVELLPCGLPLGFLGHNQRAAIPMVFLEMMLEAFPRLKSIKLCDLQVMSSSTLDADVDPNSTLATVLRDQKSLENLEWLHGSLLSPSSGVVSVDALFASLSSIASLETVVVTFPFQDSVTLNAATLATLTRSCPRLRELQCRGIFVLPCTSPVEPLLLESSQSLERLALHLPPLTSDEVSVATGKALSRMIQQSPKLTTLTVNLHLKHPYSRLEQTPIDQLGWNALQTFQETLATCLLSSNPDTQCHLTELYILCHESFARHCRTTLASFAKVVEETPSLIHLCLPQCGELDDCVSFWLRVNQTGIRGFLKQEGQSLPERLARVSAALDLYIKGEMERLSMMYYILRESPQFII
jgi:hypothetical protein